MDIAHLSDIVVIPRSLASSPTCFQLGLAQNVTEEITRWFQTRVNESGITGIDEICGLCQTANL